MPTNQSQSLRAQVEDLIRSAASNGKLSRRAIQVAIVIAILAAGKEYDRRVKQRHTSKRTGKVKAPYTESFADVKRFFPPITATQARRPINVPKKHDAKVPGGAGRVGVNKEFFRQLAAILRVAIPSLGSKQVLMLITHTFFLVVRTWLSIVVAKVDGRIVRDLVSANKKEFMKGIGYWFAIAVPATYTNSMIRFLQSKLATAFRTRLTRYVHDLYLDDYVAYYKMLNLGSDLHSPDQYITTDIARFCDTLASVYSNVGKPWLDVVLFNYQLAKYIGVYGLATLFLNSWLTARILSLISPPFGKLAAQEVNLDGEFRASHARLVMNGEEIAFLGGGKWELNNLNDCYQALAKHVSRVYKVKIWYNMLEDFIIKYCWGAMGLIVCSVPVFFPGLAGFKERMMQARNAATSATSTINGKGLMARMSSANNALAGSDDSGIGGKRAATQNSRTRGFMTNKRLLLGLSDAGGRIMYSYKELNELAGYTHRVYQLISSLHALRGDGRFTILMDEAKGNPDIAHHPNQIDAPRPLGAVEYGVNTISLEKVPIIIPRKQGSGTPTHDAADGSSQESSPLYPPTDQSAGEDDTVRVLMEGSQVMVDKLDALGERLLTSLSFSIDAGDHLFITGGNGVGKSSIARLLRGLWPVFYGTLTRPSPVALPDGARPQLFFIPQKPYLPIGTLRDQVIYPHQRSDCKATDRELYAILKLVHLGYLPKREVEGFDTFREWKDVFSGGEKQRINLARMFYHKPSFAVLDECTSAVSLDVEAWLYETAKDMGITLITISHRPHLAKYHRITLKIGGVSEAEGGDQQQGTSKEWEIESMNSEAGKMSVEREIRGLKRKLGNIEKMKNRLNDINRELGITVNA